MDTVSAPRPTVGGRAVWLRVGFAYLAFTELVIGLWQMSAPRSFYDDFPLPGHPWVSMLPAYNEHLMRDLGGLNTGMGVMLVIAAITLNHTVGWVTLLGYLIYSVPHLLFHVGHLAHYTPVDVAGQVITLGISVIVPALLLYGLLRTPRNGSHRW
ncbi:hypothetical protein [Planotetraspora mira]|uniref:DUF4345 domain-containing protein n=1 Tax=Planotetraspora mira TaxID=58121 RepID=A0A8J3TIJ1_9ACTN|nr:hypothetical protein [Planotetraspora mira]GII27683.1 hypothetical protein Pmi06nite_11250 [Planotetraspora mira]